ncbi:MAG TPA: voltage-gated potassium channel protein [Acetobacteraceae bacterium]|nr:voltage-gated potassium channel protein [Acetobacteraceae bacterium]
MSDPPKAPSSRALSHRLGVGLRQRLQRLGRAARRRLYTHLWFPHVPLFLAVGCLGLLQLRHALGIGFTDHVTARAILDMSKSALSAVVHGAPSATAGVFLVVMAFGLLTRSRLAWVIAVLATAISAMLIWLVWPGPRENGLLVYNLGVLVALFVGGSAFNRSSLTSASLFATASIVLLIAYAVLGAYLLGPDFAPPITNLLTALYFAMVTMSTVGYGDIVPKTTEARLFAISVMVLGITIFATSVSALLVPMINRRMETLLGTKEKKMVRSGHYVIAGDSSLARNTYRALTARDHPVTFILAEPPHAAAEERDVVVGDASDLDVLRRAGAQDAKAVLALSDDDSENAFVVMAAKELSDSLKTVVVVSSGRNMARVKRVHPDVIIAPQVLGGELLAMALSGEPVDGDYLMQQVLQVTT